MLDMVRFFLIIYTQDNDRRKHQYGLECRISEIEKLTLETSFQLQKAEEAFSTLVIYNRYK